MLYAMLVNSLQRAWHSVLSLGDVAAEPVTCGVVGFGHSALDAALATQHPVPGHLMQLFGPSGVGKTTLALQAVAVTQRLFPDDVCVWLDADYTFYLPYACALGVDMRRLYLVYPPAKKDVFGLLKATLRIPHMRLLVVDAAECLTPTQSAMAAHDGWRRLAKLSMQHARIILVNTHHPQGVMDHAVTTHHLLSAVAACASIRLKCLTAGYLYAGSHIVGQQTSVHVARHLYSSRRPSALCTWHYDQYNIHRASST